MGEADLLERARAGDGEAWPARPRPVPPGSSRGIQHALGLVVIGLTGDRVNAMTLFDPGALARFGLPRTLPA